MPAIAFSPRFRWCRSRDDFPGIDGSRIVAEPFLGATPSMRGTIAHRINAMPYEGDKEAGPVLDDMCQLVSEGSMLEETMVKQTWWGG